MATIRRSNTILYTDRWPETVAFYRDVLSLPVGAANDWFVEFELGPGRFVSVADAARSTIEPGHGAGITLSLQVDDVQQVRTELLAAGIPVAATGVRWGADVLDVRDPSGNRLEFWASRPPGSG